MHVIFPDSLSLRAVLFVASQMQSYEFCTVFGKGTTIFLSFPRDLNDSFSPLSPAPDKCLRKCLMSPV